LNLKKLAATMIFFSILLVISNSKSWPAEKFSLGGYFKNFSVLLDLPAYKQQDTKINEPDLGAVINRLRLHLSYKPCNFLSFYIAYDLSPRIQDPQLFEENAFSFQLSTPDYRFADFRQRLYPKPGAPVSSFGLYNNLDRLFFVWKTEFADIFVGRQAIAWGSARVINPTDVLSPFAFNELDQEERRGVDAVRMRIPLGALSELDMGFVAGKDFRFANDSFFLRGKTNLLQTDISAVLMGFRRHLLLGLDIARSIGGAGSWLEAAYVVPDYFSREIDPEEKNYLRVSAGMDYNFSSQTYGFVEYHFNCAGKNDPEKYSDLFRHAAYRDGSVYLLGKHYLNIGSTYQISPLMPFTGLLILNLSDRSLILSPMLDYNIAENIYLAAGAYLGFGKKPELVLGPLTPRPVLMRSEFGSYPDMFFTSFRIYF
jgi:hypothetical protein